MADEFAKKHFVIPIIFRPIRDSDYPELPRNYLERHSMTHTEMLDWFYALFETSAKVVSGIDWWLKIYVGHGHASQSRRAGKQLPTSDDCGSRIRYKRGGHWQVHVLWFSLPTHRPGLTP